MAETIPNPGSPEAVERGCCCPRIDNGHGLGWRGGARDPDGNVIFVRNEECLLHACASAPDRPVRRS